MNQESGFAARVQCFISEDLNERRTQFIRVLRDDWIPTLYERYISYMQYIHPLL